MLFDEATVRASDGTRLFCRIAGEGPTTLLFLHGWGGSGSGAFWDRTLQHLDPTGLRLVLADLRGHGRSDHAREGFTTERFAEDMFEVADHVGAARVDRRGIQHERPLGAVDGLRQAESRAGPDSIRTSARRRLAAARGNARRMDPHDQDAKHIRELHRSIHEEPTQRGHVGRLLLLTTNDARALTS